MTQIKDGGPAFPVPNLEDDPSFNGMTLRDYFAAKAMQAIMSAPLGKFRHGTTAEITKDAYFIADEMLKARGTP